MSITEVASLIAAASSTASIVYLLYKEFKTKPKLKIKGIWRDPSSGVSPPGKGQINPDGTYSFSVIVEVANDGDTPLNRCYGFVKTKVETRPLYDWMSYEKDLGLGKSDRFGAEPYKVFDIPPGTSKVLRTGIKASSEKASMEVVIKCGKLKDRKVVQSIMSLTFPSEPLPVSAIL
ncbi:MAG: hypothetical protein ACUVTD_09240 [Nitrososphaerales archaeon]